MILTQFYTSIFGMPSTTGDPASKANYYGRCVFQTMDLCIPIALSVLGILGLKGILPVSPITSYVFIAIGSTIGLSQFLMVLNHHILENKADRYSTMSFRWRIHFNFFERNPY